MAKNRLEIQAVNGEESANMHQNGWKEQINISYVKYQNVTYPKSYQSHKNAMMAR